MSKNGNGTKVTLLLAAGWFSVASAVVHAQTSPTAIEHVTVVDVVAGVAKPDMTVVVAGNKIASVGPASSVTMPKGTRAVDGRGKFLIPGLWDMYVHLGNATEAALPVRRPNYRSSRHGFADFRSPLANRALTGVRSDQIVAPARFTEGLPIFCL
jgi:predicted amidohydrolase YtcJ